MRMTTAAIVALASLGAVIAGPVMAQTATDETPVSTASATTSAPSTHQKIADYLASSPVQKTAPTTLYDDGPMGVVSSEEPEPRKIHGEAGVTIGSGGYKSGYVAAAIPVGESSTLGVAYSQTHYGNNGRYYYDGGYYGRPGYGYARGGTSESVAVSLDIGSLGGGRRSTMPADCAPGFWNRGEYVEPSWVRGMRADGERCLTR